ncbi:NADH-quinone oxidoreductase subunit NuoE [candidate division WOR-3 bacterium]|nr:NADH-quinone oxidoreductase subunit NuoE [candidate division WOR-3 bacterium]
MNIDLSEAAKAIDKYRDKKGALIPLLQEIQDIYGYVSSQAIGMIAHELNIYPVHIYGVLTFYTQFYLTPRGKHTIKVCQGTACHVMGGKELLDYLADKLGVEVGETTEDRNFSLERVACLGCCGIAPVIMVDEDFYGRCTIKDLDALLDKYTEDDSSGSLNGNVHNLHKKRNKPKSN